jgi:hypothetical protein
MFPYLEVHVILCEFNVDPYNVGGGLGLISMCKPIGNMDINATWIKHFFPLKYLGKRAIKFFYICSYGKKFCGTLKISKWFIVYK